MRIGYSDEHFIARFFYKTNICFTFFIVICEYDGPQLVTVSEAFFNFRLSPQSYSNNVALVCQIMPLPCAFMRLPGDIRAVLILFCIKFTLRSGFFKKQYSAADGDKTLRAVFIKQPLFVGVECGRNSNISFKDGYSPGIMQKRRLAASHTCTFGRCMLM